MTDTPSAESGTLEDVLVVDATTRGPGPYATRVLARLGARVIKVEPPLGDPSRAMPQIFQEFNAGKESVVCALDTAEGRAFARGLAGRAHVFVHSWPAGRAATFGLDAAALAEANPGLVHCTISGYGPGSPLGDRPGQDLSYLAASGALATLYPGEPQIPGIPYGDTLAGTQAATRILAALLRARSTGRGAAIEVSVTAVLAEPARIGRLAAGTPLAAGFANPGKAVYHTADDRRLVVAILDEDAYWAGLCDALGLADVRTLTTAERFADAAALRARVQRALSGMDAAEATRRLGSRALPWAFVEEPGALAFAGGLPLPEDVEPALGEHTAAVHAEFAVRDAPERVWESPR